MILQNLGRILLIIGHLGIACHEESLLRPCEFVVAAAVVLVYGIPLYLIVQERIAKFLSKK